MAPSPQLAQPGSSSYSSNIFHAGDGTWDSSRDTFLLPNLQSLPLAVTQYNGMGNRFRALAEYHTLIRGHAILAAITFLGLVPAAIMIARFYRPNPRLALRLHIWIQILTLFLVTIIFTLGWFAVGPERSLTNPHHDVGLTIYVLVWFQILWGWLTYRTEKGKQRFKTPVRLMLHQWLGRATALLALAQIGTGITLYGSPKALFILYALALALLIFIYFVLSYRYQTALMDGGSYFSGSYDSAVSPPRRERSRHRGLKALAGVTAGAVGLEAWRRHRRRSQEERRTEVTSSRRTSRPSRPSGSFIDEEKFSEPSVRDHTWRNRLLGAGAAAGGIAAIRGWMNRRNRTEVASDVSSYTHGPVTAVTQEDVHRVQAGHAPASPAHTRIRPPTAAAGVLATGSPLRRPAPRRSGNSVSSFTSLTEEEEHVGHHDMHHDEHHDARYGVREGITALGVAGFGKYLWDRSRRRREDRRSEEIRRQDRMQEEIARRNSHGRRYTGDGSPSHRRPRPPAAGGSIVTLDDSALTGSVPALSHQHLPRPGATPGPSTLPVTPLHPPPSNIPMPPPPGSTITSIPPPPPPISDPMVVHDSSGSEAYTSPGGGHHRRHRLRDNAAAGAALGAATAAARPHSQDRVESPPVSVKVKMHNDGRHVTLRRLNEQEAAAEREARRRERRRRNGSLSSLDGGNNTGDERWRRVEAMEAAQAAELAQAGPSGTHPSQHNVPPPGAPIAMPMPPPHGPGPAPMTPAQAAHAMHLPPPPPIPGSGLGGSAVGGVSPPSAYGTETDLSNYENNRRRRRAERMKAKAAQGSSGRVEFQ